MLKALVGKNNKDRLDYVALKIIFLQRILKFEIAIRLEDNMVFQPTGQSESRQYLQGCDIFLLSC